MAADRAAFEWLERVEESRARERAALEAILLEQLKEQKRVRRGKNGFRLFLALLLSAVFWINTADQWRSGELQAISHNKKHTAVVDIRGPILAATNNSSENIIKGLGKAFEDPDTAGVVIRINSPGGSPVQSGQVYDEIIRLRQQFPKMPFFAVLEDVCASGGYYIAAAAPLVYADKATLVGSIGVIMQGFGFQETLNKLGMESRLITSGKNKAFLNPFGPVNDTEKAHAQSLLDTIHKQFVEAVRKGRGDRLKAAKTELFEGLIWTGEEAVALGLVDGLGSTQWVARELIKQEQMVNFTQKNDWINRISKEMGID
ncbi:MAG: S49 family peptidase [Magnetococcales bacterium]|nr:S49 family peptidase [Magnetococcales bacterium]MBF0582614.1 S49 family peptidase [Magnetococcales bacterium]